jgi:hypothetical protein
MGPVEAGKILSEAGLTWEQIETILDWPYYRANKVRIALGRPYLNRPLSATGRPAAAFMRRIGYSDRAIGEMLRVAPHLLANENLDYPC